MMRGQVSVDTPVAIPPAAVWEVFRGLGLVRLVNQLLADTYGNTEVLNGDGGVGTIIKLTYAPGSTPAGLIGYKKEKFTKVDHETRTKETEVIEGGYKDLGFDFVGSKLEILDKLEDSNSCIVRYSIIYEVDGKLSDLPSKLSLKPIEILMGTIAKHLAQSHKTS